MSSPRIKWSPNHDDLFLTFGPKVNLYQVVKEIRSPDCKDLPGVRIAENTYAIHQPQSIEIPMTKTVSWYPKPEPDKMVAIGLANGRVVLNSFADNSDREPIGKEFVPKHTRTCIYLEWNPVDSHLLAEGLEKYRNDGCINIWNIHQKNEMGFPQERQRYSSVLSDAGNVVYQPYIELGPSETTASFSWFPREPRTFVTGMNARYLRIFDLRDLTRPHSVAQSKAIKGICVDPRNEFRIASYYEQQVCVWDVRNFEKPTLTFPEAKSIAHISWCPTRTGFLAVLVQESISMKLYDIHATNIAADELEHAYTERNIRPINNQPIVSFCWHPVCENRMLTITNQAHFRDVTVYERFPVIWSSSFHLSFACGKSLRDQVLQQEGVDTDISLRMKERALEGYGLEKDDVWANTRALRDEVHLHGLWRWLCFSRELAENLRLSQVQTKNNVGRYIGIRVLLGLDQDAKPASSPEYMAWVTMDGSMRNRLTIRQYHCEERSKALQLCGWGDRRNKDSVERVIYFLQKNNEFSKAAALALFNLEITHAIDILSNSSSFTLEEGEPNHNAVAMALAGYTEERNTLWRKTCTRLLQTLVDPYLRAMFIFLAGDRENFDDILKDTKGMMLADKVAFACLYLNDDKLHEYIDNMSKKLTQDGNLDGMLLTGLTSEGVELLQKYVDITGDIQTAALACVYSFPCEAAKDERVKYWIESYREILDRWRLWHHRSKFDIIRHTSDHSIRVTPQSYISCNFCGKTIACNMSLASRSRPFMSGSSKPKITCCPGCSKPLPRCSLCLTNLGTPSGSALYQQKERSDFKKLLSPVNDWFAWCQNCRHGGHSMHLTQWFKEHSDCPVTGCECKCSTMDYTGRLQTLKITEKDGVS